MSRRDLFPSAQGWRAFLFPFPFPCLEAHHWKQRWQQVSAKIALIFMVTASWGTASPPQQFVGQWLSALDGEPQRGGGGGGGAAAAAQGQQSSYAKQARALAFMSLLQRKEQAECERGGEGYPDCLQKWFSSPIAALPREGAYPGPSPDCFGISPHK